MQDPWKYAAFPAAAVAGYVISTTSLAVFVGDFTGLGEYIANIIVIAVSGIAAGFLIDELVPAYLEKVRGGSGAGDLGGDDDFGGDSGGDFDFE